MLMIPIVVWWLCSLLSAVEMDIHAQIPPSREELAQIKELSLLVSSLSQSGCENAQSHFRQLFFLYQAKSRLCGICSEGFLPPCATLTFGQYAYGRQGDRERLLQLSLEYWAAIAGPAIAATYRCLSCLDKSSFVYEGNGSLPGILAAHITGFVSGLSLFENGYVREGVLYCYAKSDDQIESDRDVKAASASRYNALWQDEDKGKYARVCSQIVEALSRADNTMCGNSLYVVVLKQVLVINACFLNPVYDSAKAMLPFLSQQQDTSLVKQAVESLNARLTAHNRVSQATTHLQMDQPPFPLLTLSLCGNSSGECFADVLRKRVDPTSWERFFAKEIISSLPVGEQGECVRLWALDAI